MSVDAPVLALTDVGVRAADAAPGDPPLLQGVDLRVGRGERWALLGPNGAGKSTLLGVARGARRPDEGEVMVIGRPHGSPGRADPRLRIGVLEDVQVVQAARMTGRDVVLLRSASHAAFLGEARSPADLERASELLALLDAAHLADRRFATCSLGERQRVLLARALMREPDVVLLDEPATGLDLPSREVLMAVLDRLAIRRPELATVTVTHHLEELPASTTHALLLRDGATVASGPVGDVLTDERLSACFGVDVAVGREGGRWHVRATGVLVESGAA